MHAFCVGGIRVYLRFICLQTLFDQYRFVQGYLNSVRSKVMKREGKEFVHWMFCELSDGTIDRKFSFNVFLKLVFYTFFFLVKDTSTFF